jgi:hypothetical protein
MATPKKDPLLAISHVVLVLADILFIFSIAMVVIGLGAVLTVQRGEVLADLAAAGAPGGAYRAVVAALFFVLALLSFGMLFVRQLRSIVKSVDQGDPFEPENATRLARMGWYAIGVLACQLAIAPIAAAYGQYADAFEGGSDADAIVASNPSLAALVVAVLLFILARVFRKGAEMRDDLEGTV